MFIFSGIRWQKWKTVDNNVLTGQNHDSQLEHPLILSEASVGQLYDRSKEYG